MERVLKDEVLEAPWVLSLPQLGLLAKSPYPLRAAGGTVAAQGTNGNALLKLNSSCRVLLKVSILTVFCNGS